MARLSEKEQDLSRRLGQASGQSSRADPWVNLDEIRKALPENSVLVDISRFQVHNFQRKANDPWSLAAHYAAWIVPAAGQGDVGLIDLGEAQPIEAAVQAVQQAFKQAPRAIVQKGEPESEKAVQQRLQTLSRLVLQPLLPHLKKTSRWLLSPDAALWLVPWAALPLPDNRYAVEKYQISYLISGRDLVRPGIRVKATRPMGLADPDYDLGSAQARAATQELVRGPQPPSELRGLSSSLVLGRVQRLPGTAAEARAIKPACSAMPARSPGSIYRNKR